MSVWTTKALDRVKDYVVVKHKLPGVNYVVNGVKFRGGYAVIEKNSKTYHELTKIPILRGAEEFPITHLRKLPFITRTKDVNTIYGRDVYVHFLNKEQEENTKVLESKGVEEPVVSNTCSYKTSSNELCGTDKAVESPNGYCRKHLLLDPKLTEFGIEVPEVMTTQEKKEFRRKVSEKLYKLKQEGKF